MANMAERLGFGPTRVEEKATLNGVSGYKIDVTPGAIAGPGLPTQTIFLTEDQHALYLRWKSGRVMIQDALPDLSPSDLEILQSGIGPEDWDRLFPDDEEDDPQAGGPDGR